MELRELRTSIGIFAYLIALRRVLRYAIQISGGTMNRSFTRSTVCLVMGILMGSLLSSALFSLRGSTETLSAQ